MHCYIFIVKGTLLHTAFSAILPVGLVCLDLIRLVHYRATTQGKDFNVFNIYILVEKTNCHIILFDGLFVCFF